MEYNAKALQEYPKGVASYCVDDCAGIILFEMWCENPFKKICDNRGGAILDLYRERKPKKFVFEFFCPPEDVALKLSGLGVGEPILRVHPV